MTWRPKFAALAVCCGMAAVAHAEDETAATPPVSYEGVTPSGGEPPQPPPETNVRVATWPGFKYTDTRTDVFVQLSGAQAPYHLKKSSRRIELTFDATRIHLRNNLRPIHADHFAGPVRSFRLKRGKGNKVILQVDLKQPAEPTLSTSTVGRYTYFTLSFSHT